MSAAEAVLRVLYVSRRTGTAAEEEVTAILAAATRNNPPLGITGALLADEASFGQVLEGPAAEVEALFERIQCDPRHRAVTLIAATAAESRVFPAMTCAWRGADEAVEALGAAAQPLLATLRHALARLSATAP